MSGEPADRVLEALAHPYRRQLLLALLQRAPRYLENASRTTGPFGVVSDRTGSTEGITRSLHHIHLPKLEEFGYVSRDERIGRLTRGDNWPEIRPALQLLPDDETDLPSV